MKNGLVSALGVVALLMIVVATQPADAQTISAGPYYATPSWDQKLQCDTQATCPRFIVLSNWNNAAVLDRETGLVWEQSPGTTRQTWPNAQPLCNNKVVGNRKGWRLPTIQELASLLDPSVPGLALPAGHPFSNINTLQYWSATTIASNTSFAWIVIFGSGDVTSDNKDPNFKDFVWCVRGESGGDPQ